MRSLIAILMLTCLPTTLALAAERPDWAYPPAQQGAVPTEPDDGKPLQAAGSTKFYTRKEPEWAPAPLLGALANCYDGRSSMMTGDIGP